MNLEIIPTSPELIQEAYEYFHQEYIAELHDKPFFEESLVGRLMISKSIGNTYLPQTEDGIPKFQDDHYWSLSHKLGVVYIGVSDTPIGVDIEIYKERDTSLLETFSQNEYEMLGGKNWKNFYLLWTVQEAIIKYKRETNYTPDMYSFISVQEHRQSVSGIEFQYIFTFGDNYSIVSGMKDNYIYSVCC